MKKKVLPNVGVVILTCFSLGILISVNYCAAKLTNRFGWRLDMTSNQLYKLSEETKDVLRNLEQDVHIRVFSSEADFLPLAAEVLEQYKQYGNHRISVEYIDPYTQPTLIDSYIQRGYTIELGSIAVESDQYTKVLQLSDMFVTTNDENAVQEIKCEQQLSGAIVYVAGTESHTVQFITGHNESVSDGLLELFQQSNYETEMSALSMSGLDKDTDLVVIADPTSDFSESEIEVLDTYMRAGGRLLIFMGPSSETLSGLKDFLAEWGIGIKNVVVAEPLQCTDSNPLSIVPVYTSHSINQYFAGNQLYLVMPSSRGLDQLFVSQREIRTQKLLYSTDRAYDFQKKDGEKGPFTLAMTAEKKVDSGNARVVVIGSRGIYSDSLLKTENYANGKFLAQVMNWCTETESAVYIPSKIIGNHQISVTMSQILWMAGIFMFLLPTAVLVIGFIIYYRRRHS